MTYFYLMLQGLLLGIAATWLFEQILKINKNLRNRYYKRHKIILGYHTHHSTYGLLLNLASIVLSFSQPEVAIFCSAFGIGIIAMHTLSSGRLVFIEKERG